MFEEFFDEIFYAVLLMLINYQNSFRNSLRKGLKYIGTPKFAKSFIARVMEQSPYQLRRIVRLFFHFL